MQYSTELQKLMVAFNQSNEVLLYVSATANCSLIYSHKASSLPHREGTGQLNIQLLSHHTGYCGPIWGQYSVMWYVAALNTHLMTKYEIDNDVDSMPQWISGELFIGSGKKYDNLKEKQVLVCFFWDYERKGYLCCSAEWIDYDKVLCMAWLSQHCTALTNYPKVTQYVIQMLHSWLYSGGRTVVYSVDKTLPSWCRSGLAGSWN